MKKIFFFTCILIAGLCFTSCSKDDGGSNGNLSKKLEGLWCQTELYEEGYGLTNKIGEYWEFNSDNSVQSYFDELEKGKYSNGYITGITMQYLIDREHGWGPFNYSVENGELWIAGRKEGKITFTNDNKFKIEANGYYSIFERVKGFK